MTQKAIEALEAVLCDPEGNVCIQGSDGDRAVIKQALESRILALLDSPEMVKKLCTKVVQRHGYSNIHEYHCLDDAGAYELKLDIECVLKAIKEAICKD